MTRIAMLIALVAAVGLGGCASRLQMETVTLPDQTRIALVSGNTDTGTLSTRETAAFRCSPDYNNPRGAYAADLRVRTAAVPVLCEQINIAGTSAPGLLSGALPAAIHAAGAVAAAKAVVPATTAINLVNEGSKNIAQASAKTGPVKVRSTNVNVNDNTVSGTQISTQVSDQKQINQ